MASLPNTDEMINYVAEKAVDEYKLNGKTVREWITILSGELSIVEKIWKEVSEIEIHSDGMMEGVLAALAIIDRYREAGEVKFRRI